ncbi:MAG: ATP-binding protein [Prevotella sp.]|nr:ATP-binding protein [Prevotella sp.]
MGLIKKATEMQIPSIIKMMIYGQAGTGKTTLALSAPKPLLLDFDNGAKRVNLSHLNDVDMVQVSKWDDVLAVLREDLTAYQSIVVDTVGKMMDFIITYKCGSRLPRIQDWGAINQEFQNFTRNLSNLGKNVIFIAHRDTRKNGDDTVFIPSLREKNFASVVSELDLLGYVEMKTDAGVQLRKITFDPTAYNEGKNTCNLPSEMQIPLTVDGEGNAIGKNDFIQREIIERYFSMLNKKKEQKAAYDEVMFQIKDYIQSINSADDANTFIERIDEFKHVGASMAMAGTLMMERAKTLGLTFDKVTKRYITNKGEA